MNVTSAQTPVGAYKEYDKEVADSRKAQQQAVDDKQKVNSPANQKDTVELTGGTKQTKATYNKPDYATINALKAESDRATNQLRQLVEQLLKDQGSSYNNLLRGRLSNGQIKVDATTQAEAQKLIADDGPMGAEAVSNRIVDFAIAISGGDPAQYDKLKAAIEKGFGEAKKALGGELPDISKKTYDLVMEKLDKWAGKTSEE